MNRLKHSKDMVVEDRLFVYQKQNTVPFNADCWSHIQKRFHMTKRELQIANLACQGFSNEKIAKTLKIPIGTVRSRLHRGLKNSQVNLQHALQD